MNSPFGRLSLWIIIAIAVLLLGGCARPLALAGGDRYVIEPSSPNSHFALLPVPRNDMLGAAFETQPMIEAVPPPVDAPENRPAPMAPQNQMAPTGRVARGPLRWRPPQRAQNRQRQFAHHPAYPHHR